MIFYGKKYRYTSETVENFHDNIGEDAVMTNNLDFAKILNSKAVINNNPSKEEVEEEENKTSERKAKREARRKARKEKRLVRHCKRKT